MKYAVLALALLLAAPAFASDESDILTVINKMNDALNKNDVKTATGTYSSSATIIDEFAPHYWSGSNAASDWWKAFGDYAQSRGDTDPWLTLSKPTHMSVTGEHGYAVLPALFTFKEKGKKMMEHGTMTFAMQKGANGWEIAGWTWSRR